MSFTNPSNLTAPGDVVLTPLVTGTDVVEQRNGATSQSFRLHNTWTDASNYERFNLRWSSNIMEFRVEGGGSGSHRDLKVVTSGAEQMLFTSAGVYTKTLMGYTDNSRDVGSASYRYRDLHLGRDAYMNGLPTSDPSSAGQLWNDSGTLKVSAG